MVGARAWAQLTQPRTVPHVPRLVSRALVWLEEGWPGELVSSLQTLPPEASVS